MTVYVDDDGYAEFTKIQDAIDIIADGGTIFVSNGTYNETLILDKSINLIGESADKTIINLKEGSLPASNAIVQINADNCKIKDFKITSARYTLNSIAIQIKSSNNIISNNTILYPDKGIYLDINSKYNTISGNNFSEGRYGIETYNTFGNNIVKNNISSYSTYGIFLLGSDNNTLSDNMISENVYGIRLRHSENNTIFKNTIRNNQYGMYFCCGGFNNLIYYNALIGNNDYNVKDDVTNQWDNGSYGNYWDDYEEKYPDATRLNGIWDTPYFIPDGYNNIDRFPLVNSVLN